MSASNHALGLRLVGASAGSGKTYRLTQEVTRSLDPNHDSAIRVEGLMAVTYTTKAQAELESRLRRGLFEKGEFERAQLLPMAYIGTVHAVCLRLLKEFAIDLGLSPAVDGLPQEAARRLLQAALDSELSPELRQRLDTSAGALEINYDGRNGQYDWVTRVEEIMTLARNNRIAPETLPEMAQRSLAGFIELLGPPLRNGDALEEELAAEVRSAISALSDSGNERKNTLGAIEELRDAERMLKRGRLPWSRWCKLTKLAPAKPVLPLVAEVKELAAQYEIHPRFQSDVRALCEAVFEAAQVGLTAFAMWKDRRGLVDYVDMVDRALTALETPSVAAEHRRRLELLVVDEFQDTSPIQLALFMRLHALCQRSVWVGDQKQCIFEYAGADPGLMDAVTRWVSENGGASEQLAHNYRSRPELVAPTSELFARAFARHGQGRHEVVTTPKRATSLELAGLPPFGVWWLPSKGSTEHDALASGVARLLSTPEKTPVLDRASRRVRPVRPSDIAILVASNRQAQQLSLALKARGISCALPRTGLMRTPEGTLLAAALRYLVDPRDTLASAEIEALLGFGGQSHETWLSNRMGASTAGGHTTVPPALSPLNRLRGDIPSLTPSEVVDRVYAVMDMPQLARRWPDPHQRLGNLDALAALTKAYEERCIYLREAASLAGLGRYLEEAQIEIRQQDEERASDEQHVGQSEDAVVISTYHKAKGLEWPVVVLSSLSRQRKRDAFDITPESERASFDPKDPLGARWIRYWPWPLGQQRNTPLRDRADASAVGKRISQRDGRERVRLLYVGFTRARDHLILAVGTNSKGTPQLSWLDELADDDGPLLELPPPDAHPQHIVIRGSGVRAPARSWALEPMDAPATRPAPFASTWFARSSSTTREPATKFTITPSETDASSFGGTQARVTSRVRLTRRMPFACPKNTSWDHVGTTLHAFLAADSDAFLTVRRLALAKSVLRRAGLEDAFEPSALVAASDALRGFVQERWPDAVWQREVPIAATVNTPDGIRLVQGTIDLLLETECGLVVIDHKSFPGRAEQWESKALEYAPQLATYQVALQATGREVVGSFVHFTIGGGMLELAL